MNQRRPSCDSDSSLSSGSELEDDESAESSLNVANEVRKQMETGSRGSTSVVAPSLPPEIVDKLMRRGGKNYSRAAQLKRVRKANGIQRHLEELDVKHKELEERGIIAEKSLRGQEGCDDEDAAVQVEEGAYDPEMVRQWFQLLAQKNTLIRQERELLVQAKQLELEDRSAKLEMELREEHLKQQNSSRRNVTREGEILKEILEISKQREMLQAMSDKDQVRYQSEDKNIEAQMKAKGLIKAATK